MEEDTRQKILNTAKILFIEKGFAATTMRDISTAANINKGLLHYYFQSKQALFVNVMQMTSFELFPKVDTILHLEVSFQEKLELIIDVYIEFLLQNPRLPAFIINELNSNTDLFVDVIMQADIYKRVLAILEIIFSEEELKEGKIEPLHFIINLLGLILQPFLMRPLAQKIGQIDDESFSHIMRLRKKIIYDTLINSIKKETMLPNWLKFLIFMSVFAAISGNGYAQTKKILLQEAIDATIKHNPLGNQYDIYDKSLTIAMEGIRKQNYPLVTWNTQLSLQSENISLDFPIPNIDPISLPLYKAQSALETSYLLYDGGISDALVKNEKIKNSLGKQNTTVQLFQLKNQIAELYYSVLLLEKQDEIITSTIQYFKSREKMLQSMYDNGTILKSDVDKLKIEIIKLEQSKAMISNKRSILISALSDLTGLNFTEAEFEDSEALINSEKWDKRPEMDLFRYRKDLVDAGQEMTDLKNKPKVALFAKAGVGYPNPFNFFDENISPFAIGGVNFIWNIWDWKRSSIEKQKLTIDKESIDNQQAVFEENMKLETNKIKLEIEGLKKNLEFDIEIIKNQQVILTTTENQYKNGIATINAYLEEVNKKNIAELNAAVHETEIKKAMWKYKILLND